MLIATIRKLLSCPIPFGLHNSQLTFLFKIVNQLIFYPEAPLTPCTLHYPTHTVHSAPYCQLHGRTYQYLYSFLPDVISVWNSLPSNTVILSNVHNFKEAMYEYFILSFRVHLISCMLLCALCSLCNEHKLNIKKLCNSNLITIW